MSKSNKINANSRGMSVLDTNSSFMCQEVNYYLVSNSTLYVPLVVAKIVL